MFQQSIEFKFDQVFRTSSHSSKLSSYINNIIFFHKYFNITILQGLAWRQGISIMVCFLGT